MWPPLETKLTNPNSITFVIPSAPKAAENLFVDEDG